MGLSEVSPLEGVLPRRPAANFVWRPSGRFWKLIGAFVFHVCFCYGLCFGAGWRRVGDGRADGRLPFDRPEYWYNPRERR
jgi:hypothetical protein